MCSKPKFIEDAQKSVDKAIKGVQSQAQSAVNQVTGNTSSSSGGKGSGSSPIGPITLTPINFGIASNLNIPKLNLDQDLAAPVVEAIQDINVPRPNTDQDLTKISVQGLQESAVEQGTQLQQEAINTGTKIQETVVQAGSNLQEAAVQAGSSISGGQSNPTLEKAAEQVTTYVEDKVIPVVKDLYATAFGDKNPQLKFAQAIVHDFEKNTPGIEALGNLDASLNASDDNYSSNTTPYGAADLDATEATGNEAVFGDIETSTTKADKLTEEERLRRIRRLMLNRYGREDTILTGAKDPMNRRRYASAL